MILRKLNSDPAATEYNRTGGNNSLERSANILPQFVLEELNVLSLQSYLAIVNQGNWLHGSPSIKSVDESTFSDTFP